MTGLWEGEFFNFLIFYLFMYLFIVILFIYLFIIVVCFSVFMLYVAWKRGLPRNLHVLSCFVQFKKRSFNLLYVLNVHLPIYLFLPALTIFWHSFLVLPGDPQQLYVKKKKKKLKNGLFFRSWHSWHQVIYSTVVLILCKRDCFTTWNLRTWKK